MIKILRRQRKISRTHMCDPSRIPRRFDFAEPRSCISFHPQCNFGNESKKIDKTQGDVPASQCISLRSTFVSAMSHPECITKAVPPWEATAV